jgi:hypothetical protein
MLRHILNEENEPVTRTQGHCSTDDTGVGCQWGSVSTVPRSRRQGA